MEAPQTEITIRGSDGTVLLQATVTPGEYVLGRSPQAELFFEAELVSRQHARLTVNFDHLLIEDLGSANGTSINGQPVTEPTRLWPNQQVRIGSATLEDELKLLEQDMKEMQTRLAGLRRKWGEGSSKLTRARSVEEAGS